MQFERKDFKNFILIADSGYAVTSYMATPLLHCGNQVEELYNESIIRTRNVAERLFGVWKRRFPVFSLQMRLKIKTIQDIIVAVAILHNIAIDFNEELPPDVVEFIDQPEGPEVQRIAADDNDNVRTANRFIGRILPNTSRK